MAIQRVGVIGAGTMGSGIAQVAATAGNPTVLFDIDGRILDKAKAAVQASLSKLREKGKLSSEDVEKILSNIHKNSLINQIQILSQIQLLSAIKINNLRNQFRFRQ